MSRPCHDWTSARRRGSCILAARGANGNVMGKNCRCNILHQLSLENDGKMGKYGKIWENDGKIWENINWIGFHGKIFTGNPWFLHVFTMKYIRLSGFNFPIIQFYEVRNYWDSYDTLERMGLIHGICKPSTKRCGAGILPFR